MGGASSPVSHPQGSATQALSQVLQLGRDRESSPALWVSSPTCPRCVWVASLPRPCHHMTDEGQEQIPHSHILGLAHPHLHQQGQLYSALGHTF